MNNKSDNKKTDTGVKAPWWVRWHVLAVIFIVTVGGGLVMAFLSA